VKNFNKFDKGRGDKGFGGGRKFSAKGGPAFGWGGDRRNDGPKQMFPAICSQCGQSCEVPFKPTGDRPVFCSNCFKKQGGPQARFAPKSFGHKPEFRPAQVGSANTGGGVTRAQFDSLNAKLDKILTILNTNAVPETPKMDKPKIKPDFAAPSPKLWRVGDNASTGKEKKAPAKKSKAKKK